MKHLKSLRFAVQFLFLLLAAASLNAATVTTKYVILFDVDNSSATGCTYAIGTTSITGIEHVLTTTVDRNGSTATVTKVERQQCTGGTFSAPLTIDSTGWPAPVGADGTLHVVTHMPNAVLGNPVPVNMRLYIGVLEGLGNSFVENTPNGSPILYPTIGPRHRAVSHTGFPEDPTAPILDGSFSFFLGLPPMALGTPVLSGTPTQQVKNVFGLSGPSDIFFLINIGGSATGALVANDDAYTVQQGHGIGAGAPGVLTNDVNTTGSPMLAQLLTSTHLGTLTLNADGSFHYNNSGAPQSTDTFTYQATAGGQTSNSATVTFHITPDNAPVGVADSYSVAHHGTLNVPPPGVLTNDTDADHDPITAVLNSPPSHASSFHLNSNGSFTYTHDGSNTLSDSFTYRATDGIIPSFPVTVTITIGPDHAPVATADGYTVTEGGTLNVGPAGVLTNDSDPDNDAMTAVLVSGPAHATTFQLNPDGSFTYVHDDSGLATDSFTYKASDGILTSNTVTVSITITCPTITVTNPATTTGTASSPFSQTFTQSGANATKTFTTSSTLPAGLTLSAAGVLSGTPTQTGTFPIVVKVSEASGCFGTGATYTLVIGCQTINVINPATTTGVAAAAFSQTFTQSGAIGSTTFTTASTLPAGLTLSTAGVLSGTPTQTGSFPIVVTVTDSNGCTGTGATYTLTITCQTINVTNPVTNTATANAAFSQTFTQSGSIGTATFSTASTLPAGLTLSSGGVLSGTPLVTGSFPIVVTVTDSNGCTGTGATYTLTIGCQTISVTNPSTTTGTASAAFSQTFTAGNTIGTVTFTTASTLPTGLTLSTAGVLSGTPTQTGSFPIVVTATDANGCSGSGATYTLVIGCQTISVTNPANNTGTVSTPFSEQFTQSAAIGTATFSTASTLPTGLTLSSSGLLSGTPTVTGSFPIVVTVTDSNGCTGSGATYTLTINCQVITVNNPSSNSDPAGTALVAANFTFTQTGAVGGATFTTASTLPTGVTLTTAGVLTGTPTQGGSFPVTVTVTDGNGCTGTSSGYTLTITCPVITVTNPATTTGTVNVAFSQTFTQSGAIGGATFTTASTLPAGLSLSTGGVLSGTPTQSGSFPIVVTVTDGNGCQGTGSTYTLVIGCQVITVNSPATNTGTVNTAFSQTFTSSNTIGAVTYTTSSTLPAGLSLATNGTLSGTPTQTGSFPIVVTATDANGCSGNSSTYTLTIGCQVISVTNPSTTTGTASAAFSQTFTAGNTIGTVTFTTASTLPTGLSLSTGGVLSGTPTQTGTFPIVVTATDANGCSGSGSTYTLVINCQTISVTNPANNNGTVSSPFSEQFTQSGAIGTATFSTASTLPTGLTLSSSGLLSGTPTVTGTFPIVVTVTDSNGCTGSGATYTLTVACQVITVNNPSSNSDPAGTALVAANFTFTQTGAVGGATFTTVSTLPTGVTLTTAGVLTGTPTQGGSFPITVTVTDGNGCTGTSSGYTLTVTCPVITVTNPATSTGTANVAFSQTFTQSGAIGGATFTTASTLPTGLTLSAGGVLSGTPTLVGTFPIVVTVTDGNGCTGTGSTYSLVISCQVITVNNPATNTGTVNAAFSQSFTSSNTIGSVVYTTSSTLPTGLSLAANGTLSGTPTQTGTFPIVVTATDQNGCQGTGATYTLTIGCQVISVTNPATTTGTAAAAFSQTFTAGNTIGAVTFTTASTLPTGLTLSTGGVLSGTPTQTGTFPIVVTATDANGCSGSGATYNLVINCQTITVGLPATNTGTVNGSISMQFTQTGAIGTATFTTASTLPTGLTLSPSGLLSGTPTQPGTFPIIVKVTDSNGCFGNSATFTLTVSCQVITVNNPSSNTDAAGTALVAANFTFTQSGAVGGATFTTASTLPTGVTLTTGGVLTGTPMQGGSFPITVTVTDGNGCTGTNPSYTLTITCPVISVTNPGVNTGTAGVAFSQTFTQSGGIGTITWSESGVLPSGITLNTSTGVLSGTTHQVGSFPITVTATDQNGCQGTGSTYTLTINCQTISVTNPGTNTGTVDAAFTATFTATGILDTVSWSETGALPAGITLNSATGVLSGTPTVNGSFPITVKATDTNGCFGTSSYTLTINCQTITVTNPGTTTGTVDAPFSQTFTQSAAHGSATFSTASTLPAGLTLSTAGVLSGTPTVKGTFPIVVTVTDSNGCTGTGSTYTLVINCQTITVNNPATNTGTAGTAFSQTFTQSGAHATATFTTASTLPTGFTLSTAGVLSGTTTQHGSFPIVVTVTDANGCTGTGSTYTLTINCNAISVTNPATNTGTVASPFSQTFTSSGTLISATYTTASSLPTGLTLSTAGVLSGTPTQSGTFPIVVTVTDGNGCTGAGSTYTLTIACNVITVTNAVNSTGTAGTLFSATFTQSGGNGTITWSETGGLPAGITLDPSSGVLSGTTSVTGSFPITVTATDGNGCTGTGATYTLIINCQTISITNASSTTVQASTALTPAANWTFSATGILGTPTWSETGTLPTGITLSSAGVLSGTTTQIGSFPITVKVTDTNLCFGTSSYTLTVTCPTINVPRTGGGTTMAQGTYNTAGYSDSVTANGGSGTYTYALQSGSLPTGLTLSSAGVISGTPTQTGTFTFTIRATDSSTSCTGDSATLTLKIGPKVTTETYSSAPGNAGSTDSVGNTQAVAAGFSTPTTPYVSYTNGALFGDTSDAAMTVTTASASNANGTITFNSAGGWSFVPTAGFTGTASFNYNVTSNGVSTQSTININVVSKVWYVQNNAAGGGNGVSSTPFNTLAAASAASAAGDTIYVATGDGTTTGQTAGITLKANQLLIGNGVALVVNGNTLAAAGTKPQITNTVASSDAVTLNDGNTVKGLTVTGATRDGIAGATHAGFTGDTLTIQNNVSSGLHLTSMTGTVTVTNSTISGNATGLDVNNGTAAINLDNTNTITANAGQRQVSIQNRPGAAGAIAIGATINDSVVGSTGILLNANTSGTIGFTGNQTLRTTTNQAVTMTTNTGTTTTFSGTLSITSTTGSGFVASGGGTLNVTGTANVTTGAATNGLSINGMTIGASGVTFTSVTTTGATTAINLVNFTAAGLVTVNGGTITNGTTGVNLQGANTSLTLAGVTITGPTTGITNTTNFGTLTIGSSVNVSAVTALNLTTGAVSGTFANVTATAGSVILNAVTGSWGDTGGTITGAAGTPAFSVTGGSGGTITWGGAISQALANTVVTVTGSNSNTINFNGNVTSSGTSTGLILTGSSGTYNFNGTNAFSGATGILIGNGASESGTILFSANTTNTVSGSAFVIDGGAAGAVTAAVTYNGTIDKATVGSGGILVSVNKLNSPGTLSMSHAGAGSIKQNSNAANGISVTNSSSTSITIANASVTFNNTQAGFTGSGNTGTITLQGLALTANGNKAGMLISGGGTINVTDGSASSTINAGGGTARAIDGSTASYTGTLNLTNTGITDNPAGGVFLTSSTLGGTGSTITGSGSGLTLATVALTNGAGMTSVTSTGGANGISLTSCTGGTYTVSGGALSGNTGSTFLVANGSATFTFNGTMSQTAAQRIVSISGITGGTLTLGGSITGTTSCTGITLGGTGGTVTMSGLISLNGASDTFSSSTSGLTINASNTGNVIGNASAPTGPALSVSNATIGSGNLIFKTISATGGTNAIVLSTTGATGHLSILGDGTNVNNASGGTMQNQTGDAISLTSTNSPVFNQIAVQHSTHNGIKGTTVTNFTLTNSTINDSGLSGNGVTIVGTVDDSNINFGTHAAGTENNVSGTVTITNNTLTNAYYNGIFIYNFAGTISNATLSSNTITSSTTTANSQGYGMQLTAFGSAGGVSSWTKATIDSNNIQHFPSGGGIEFQAGNPTSSGAPAGTYGDNTDTSNTNAIRITNNTINGGTVQMNTDAILATIGGVGSGNFFIDSNGQGGTALGNTNGHVISVQMGGIGTLRTTINNNKIVANNVVGSRGITVTETNQFATSDAPLLIAIVTNNVTSATNGCGLFIEGAKSNGTLKATVTGNNIGKETQTVAEGAIQVWSGDTSATSGVNQTVCLTINGNTATGGTNSTATQTGPGIGIRQQATGTNTFHFNISGFGFASGTPAQMESYVAGQNPGSNCGTFGTCNSGGAYSIAGAAVTYGNSCSGGF